MALFLLSLSHMARNTVAKVFWTSPSVKQHLKMIFIHEDVGKSVTRRKLFVIKRKFYVEIYRQLENIYSSLPPAVKCQLRVSVRVFGDNLFTSLRDIVNMINILGGDLHHSMDNFIENISLTDCGTVDVSATFRKMYRAEPLEVDYYMWVLACELCLEEYILQWSPELDKGRIEGEKVEMVYFIFDDINVRNLSNFSSHAAFWLNSDVYKYCYHGHYLMYWKLWKSHDQTAKDWELFVAHFRARNLNSYYDYWNIYDEEDSIEENMFRVSVAIGNFHGVKYFWNKLTTEMKSTDMRRIIAIACFCEWNIQYSSQYFKPGRVWFQRRIQYFDIVCFLIQNLPQSQLDKLFSDPLEVSEKKIPAMKTFLPLVFLLNHERYPEFCSNIARKAFGYSGNKLFTEAYLEMMDKLCDILHKESRIHGEAAFDALYEFWRLCPIDSTSEMRNHLQRYWLRKEEFDPEFDSVLDKIIDFPGLPKFVEDEDEFSELEKIRIPSLRKET